MEKNIPKIILYISLIPYGLVLLYGIYSAIAGIDFFGRSYGFDGFIAGIVFSFAFLCMIPVVPICFVYQIAYLLRRKVKPLQNVSIKKFIAGVIAAVAVIAVIILCNVFKYEVRETIDGWHARAMLRRAEEKIEYEKSHFHMGGIFGIRSIKHDMVLIDYDKPEIGLIRGSSIDKYDSIRLSKTTAGSDIIRHMEKDYFVQSVTELSSPGKRLITLAPDEKRYHGTIAVIMEMENGLVYYGDNLKDRNDYDTLYAGLSGLDGFAGTYSEETWEMQLPRLSDLEPLG